MDFAAGMRVDARGLAWELLEVEQLGGQQRLHLRCVAGDLHGLTWDILHPHETVEILHGELRPEAPGTLAAWRLHQIAGLLEQLPGSDEWLASEPGRVTIEPYQLVPLMRALEMPRPRLLLADGVGLGKTVQAGLIATELLARRRAHRILVVSPAGPLLLQWRQELRERFGLRFTAITDAASLQQERRRLELGGNPFDSVALCLVSLDFAKQERVLEELERAAWDLAIIDEAHHCISNAVSTDPDDTLRRRLAEVVARRSDGLLLLTATPHDGYDAHFASLIALLDPSLVDGRGGLVGMAYRRHVVRRLKSHIRDAVTGAPLFRERRVIPVRIAPSNVGTEAVQTFHAALAALVSPRLRRAARPRQDTDALAFIGLLKRSVSTIAACVATLRVVAERYGELASDQTQAAALRKEQARALRAYRRRLLRFGTLDAASEDDAASLEADSIADELHRRAATNPVLESLRDLIRLGGAAAAHDPKLAAMLDEVRLIRIAEPAANILIYTEYADSQAAALHALRAARGISGDILAISGADPEAERTRAAERCAEADDVILVSTDSMAEGLNLQARCRHLIHLDLPYNPNRLEQRNGRIDRYGQKHAPQIRYLYLAGSFEEHLLLRLIGKYENARARLDFMPDTLGVTADMTSAHGLVAGFAEQQAPLFNDAAPAIRTLDQTEAAADTPALRDLLHEIDRAFAGFERQAVRHGWLTEHGATAERDLRVATAAPRHSRHLLGPIDLVDFVAASIAADTGAQAERGRLPLPGDWSVGMADLPGYDATNRMLRVTRRRDRLHDAAGHSLAFLGHGHPLVRRAIGRARRGAMPPTGTDADCRVAAAASDTRIGLAVLLLFTAEAASARRSEWQRVLAILLPRNGHAVELPPADWLRLAAPARSINADDAWRRRFAFWVPRRMPAATELAESRMRELAATFATQRQAQTQEESEALQRWMQTRADDICGPVLGRTGDLFDPLPTLPGWRSDNAPDARLISFATDAENPPTRRREADSTVALFHRRQQQQAERASLSPPRLLPSGMLMLLPPA